MNNIGTSVIGFLEKSLLTVVAALTVIATLQELLAIFDARKVQLADLLLLFLYTNTRSFCFPLFIFLHLIVSTSSTLSTVLTYSTSGMQTRTKTAACHSMNLQSTCTA